MYRNQGYYHRQSAPPAIGRAERMQRLLMPPERPINWGAYEVLSSALFIALSLLFVLGIAVLVLEIVGFDSLTQLYGFDLMVEHFEL